MFQEKRKQGLAFWIEWPWGAGGRGLVQIKLMLLMALVLAEMGAAAVSTAAEPLGGGKHLPGSRTRVQRLGPRGLDLEGTQVGLVLEKKGSLLL